jgi:hypothetical protein
MLKNIIQIINGCGGAETIEECAYLPMQLGATIIVVDAIWPQYQYPNGDPNYAKSADLMKPDYRYEDLQSISDRNGWHYLKMDKFAFNGEQYNYALDYIKNEGMPCEYIYFIDSDECLDPVYLNIWLSHIDQCKKQNLNQLRFNKTLEILPGWKTVEVDERWVGSYGIVWGDALEVRREEYFDGNFYFKSPVPFGVTEAPLYHLHHFRKNAARRITDGFFDTGGKAYRIADAPDIIMTAYTKSLKDKFGDRFQLESQSLGSYMGKVIFDKL